MASHLGKYQYKDPVQIDLSLTGKVMELKQQKYDAASAQIQQLIDSYVGMNLARPQDEEYLANRIGTLVNYVNEAGVQDLSDSGIARNVGNYITSALDQNVENAIYSTNLIKAQNAEIEKAKEEGTYHLHNEWLAKQHLGEYMQSEQVGEIYKAQSYIPYTDVNKLILENIDKIQEFEDVYVEYGDTGTPLIKEKRTMQRVSPEKAKQVLEYIIGDKGKQQWAIDAAYEFRNATPEQIDEVYAQYVDSKISDNNTLINYYSSLKKQATAGEREQLDNVINNLRATNEKISKEKTKATSPMEKLNSFYIDSKLSNLGETFSYNKLKDIDYDDSMFKIYKESNLVDYRNQQLQIDKAKLDLDMMKALSEGKVTQNEDGTYSPVIGGGYEGFSREGVAPNEEEDALDVTTTTLEFSSKIDTLASAIMEKDGIGEREAKAKALKLVQEGSIGQITPYGLSQEDADFLEDGYTVYSQGRDMANALIEGAKERMMNVYAEGDHRNFETIPMNLRNKAWDDLTEAEKNEVTLAALYAGELNYSGTEKDAYTLARVHLSNKLGYTEQQVKEKFEPKQSETLMGHLGNVFSTVGGLTWNSLKQGYYGAIDGGWLGDRIADFTSVDPRQEKERLQKEEEELDVELDNIKNTEIGSYFYHDNTDPSEINTYNTKDRKSFKMLNNELGLDTTIKAIKDNFNTKRSKTYVTNIDLNVKTPHVEQIVSTVIPRLAKDGYFLDQDKGAHAIKNDDGSVDMTVYVKDERNSTTSSPTTYTIPAAEVPGTLNLVIDDTEVEYKYSLQNPDAKPYRLQNVKAYENEEQRNQAMLEHGTKFADPRNFGLTVSDIEEELKRTEGLDLSEISKAHAQKIREIIRGSYDFVIQRNQYGDIGPSFSLTTADGTLDIPMVGKTNIKDIHSAPVYQAQKDLLINAVKNNIAKYIEKNNVNDTND